MTDDNKYRVLMREKREILISLCVISIVLVVCIITSMMTGLSWFSSNVKTNSTGMSIRTSCTNLSISAYRVVENVVNDITVKSLVDFNSAFELNMIPGDEVTIVIIAKKLFDTDVNLTASADNLSVCYYQLQKGSEYGTYNNYITGMEPILRPYINGGNYSYIDASTIYTVNPADISVNNYLSFVRPVSNTITVAQSNAISLSNTNSDFNALKTIAEGNIEALIYQPESQLYTGNNFNAEQMYNKAADEYTDITNGTGYTGTSFTFSGVSGAAIMIAYKFTYEDNPNYYVNSTFQVNSTDRTVYLNNSNPYMFQRLRIGSFSIS